MLNKTLRRVTFLFVIALATFSCNENDDVLETSGSLVGDWELTSYTYSGETSATIQGNTLINTFTGMASNIDYIITFGENPNKAIIEDGSFDIELISSVNGMSTTENIMVSNIDSQADWVRNGNVLTFTGSFGSFDSNIPTTNQNVTNPTYIIEELTDTTLILTSLISEQITNSDIDFDVNASIRLELNRI